jgi:hypothetical protein
MQWGSFCGEMVTLDRDRKPSGITIVLTSAGGSTSKADRFWIFRKNLELSLGHGLLAMVELFFKFGSRKSSLLPVFIFSLENSPRVGDILSHHPYQGF